MSPGTLHFLRFVKYCHRLSLAIDVKYLSTLGNLWNLLEHFFSCRGIDLPPRTALHTHTASSRLNETKGRNDIETKKIMRQRRETGTEEWRENFKRKGEKSSGGNSGKNGASIRDRERRVGEKIEKMGRNKRKEKKNRRGESEQDWGGGGKDDLEQEKVREASGSRKWKVRVVTGERKKRLPGER
jgi:hypothetical protein